MGQCRNPIKSAKGATNNIYFTVFLLLKYIYRPFCVKIAIFFFVKVQHLKTLSLIMNNHGQVVGHSRRSSEHTLLL